MWPKTCRARHLSKECLPLVLIYTLSMQVRLKPAPNWLELSILACMASRSKYTCFLHIQTCVCNKDAGWLGAQRRAEAIGSKSWKGLMAHTRIKKCYPNNTGLSGYTSLQRQPRKSIHASNHDTPNTSQLTDAKVPGTRTLLKLRRRDNFRAPENACETDAIMPVSPPPEWERLTEYTSDTTMYTNS